MFSLFPNQYLSVLARSLLLPHRPVFPCLRRTTHGKCWGSACSWYLRCRNMRNNGRHCDASFILFAYPAIKGFFGSPSVRPPCFPPLDPLAQCSGPSRLRGLFVFCSPVFPPNPSVRFGGFVCLRTQHTIHRTADTGLYSIGPPVHKSILHTCPHHCPPPPSPQSGGRCAFRFRGLDPAPYNG